MNAFEKRVYGLFVILMVMAGGAFVYSQTPPGPNTTQHGEGINYPTVTATDGYFYGAANVTGSLLGDFGAYDIETTGDITGATVDAQEFFLNAVNKTDILAYPQTEASYVIWVDGAIYYAKNGDTGVIDYSGADASTVIQAAINATPIRGLVFVKDDIVLTSTLKILKTLNVIFNGKITAEGINAIELGDAINSARYSSIQFSELNGVNKVGNGIVIKYADNVRIVFQHIYNCNNGIYFDGTVNGAENKIYGGVIRLCNKGIVFAPVAVWMEGNLITASIFGCNSGLEIPAGASAGYTMFIGVIDNADVGGIDLNDLKGKGFFLCYFLREDASVWQESSILINAVTGMFYGSIGRFGSTVNLLPNSDFEVFQVDGKPRGYNAVATGGTYGRETTEVYRDKSSFNMISGNGEIGYVDYFPPSDIRKFLNGEPVTLSVWVKTSTANRVRIGIYDDIGAGLAATFSGYHSGSGNWELLSVTRTLRNSLTNLLFRPLLISAGAPVTVYIDAAIATMGKNIIKYSPSIVSDSYRNSGTATILNTTTSIVVPHGCSYTPSAVDVTLTLTNNPTNDPGNLYVDTFTATQMTIRCRNDPGATGAIIAWAIRRTP